MNALAIRVDANEQIGIGHAMRCFALAEAARERGIAVHMLYQSCPSDILDRYASIGATTQEINWAPFYAEDGKRSAEKALEVNARWMIVDSYQTYAEFVAAVKSLGIHVMAIDDDGREAVIGADIIVNQNISACSAWYEKSHASLRLGTDYVMLRSDFRHEAHSPEKNAILITTGGGDDLNISPHLVRALIDKLEADETIQLVIGPANPHAAEIIETFKDLGQVSLLKNVSDMPKLIRSAKLVITGAGSTVWECLALGTPFITMILADNQIAIAEHLSGQKFAPTSGDARDSGFIDRLGEQLDYFRNNPTAFTRNSRRGKELIDGRGVFRILDSIQ